MKKSIWILIIIWMEHKYLRMTMNIYNNMKIKLDNKCKCNNNMYSSNNKSNIKYQILMHFKIINLMLQVHKYLKTMNNFYKNISNNKQTNKDNQTYNSNNKCKKNRCFMINNYGNKNNKKINDNAQ